VSGRRSSGRFALHSRRDGGAEHERGEQGKQHSAGAAGAADAAAAAAAAMPPPADSIPTMKDKDLSIEIDAQLMQVNECSNG